MRPLTKMVIYADSSSQETGRLIYLRKNERLILRVEGRSPNDDPASFQIKFGGSFIALAPEKTIAEPTVAGSNQTSESGVRVNSVGTIIEVIQKPIPAKAPKSTGKAPPVAAVPEGGVAKTKPKERSGPPKKVTEPIAATVSENETATPVVEVPKKPSPKPPIKRKPPAKPKQTTAKRSKPPEKAPETPAEPVPDPLASIWLVIELKDGNTIRRPMSEVMKFNVEKGVLVVVARNGKIVRYPILDVAKVTIE